MIYAYNVQVYRQKPGHRSKKCQNSNKQLDYIKQLRKKGRGWKRKDEKWKSKNETQRTGWSKKTDTQFYFWDNFGNSVPILTIVTSRNLWRVNVKFFHPLHLYCVTTLP